MLSRTAENLFWIGRYMERAETGARLMAVGARNALIPNIGGGYRNEWESVLEASGTRAAFEEKYGDAVQRNIESHMFFDNDNSSSVASCISAARENARIVPFVISQLPWMRTKSPMLAPPSSRDWVPIRRFVPISLPARISA